MRWGFLIVLLPVATLPFLIPNLVFANIEHSTRNLLRPKIKSPGTSPKISRGNKKGGLLVAVHFLDATTASVEFSSPTASLGCGGH